MDNRYAVKPDFNGGYIIINANAFLDWHSVARFDVEGGEFFAEYVTETQKQEIRDFAQKAGIL